MRNVTSAIRRGNSDMERNDYQNAFLRHIAEMQEIRVELTLGEHKLYEHDAVCDFIRYE